jgi:hypothetical protein
MKLHWLVIAGLLACLDLQAAEVKWVEIDKSRQELRAYEGARLVLKTHVSTGRWDGSTPNGVYNAGIKQLMHYSSLYHNAEMPFSVQVTGNVFIHGYSDVPDRPASHGCIRVPLTGDNPARQFYEWVEPGTPIFIIGKWRGKPAPVEKPRITIHISKAHASARVGARANWPRGT